MSKLFLFLALCSLAFTCQAATPPELMEKAMKTGIAKGEITGPLADAISKTTHSKAPPIAVLERLEEVGGCQYFKFTLSQADIPMVAGGIAGEYRTVTKVGTCRGDAEAKPPLVLECKVGKNSCMPQAKQ